MWAEDKDKQEAEGKTVEEQTMGIQGNVVGGG